MNARRGRTFVGELQVAGITGRRDRPRNRGRERSSAASRGPQRQRRARCTRALWSIPAARTETLAASSNGRIPKPVPTSSTESPRGQRQHPDHLPPQRDGHRACTPASLRRPPHPALRRIVGVLDAASPSSSSALSVSKSIADLLLRGQPLGSAGAQSAGGQHASNGRSGALTVPDDGPDFRDHNAHRRRPTAHIGPPDASSELTCGLS